MKIEVMKTLPPNTELVSVLKWKLVSYGIFYYL